MIWSDIVSSLETYLTTLGIDMPVAYDNVKFQSVPGVPHIRVSHHPVDTAPLTIGSHGVMEVDGIMELGLSYPAGSGSGAALSMADVLSQSFLPGSSLIAGSGSIVISKTTLGSKYPGVTPDWLTYPVTVYYKAYHNY